MVAAASSRSTRVRGGRHCDTARCTASDGVFSVSISTRRMVRTLPSVGARKRALEPSSTTTPSRCVSRPASVAAARGDAAPAGVVRAVWARAGGGGGRVLKRIPSRAGGGCRATAVRGSSRVGRLTRGQEGLQDGQQDAHVGRAVPLYQRAPRRQRRLPDGGQVAGQAVLDDEGQQGGQRRDGDGAQLGALRQQPQHPHAGLPRARHRARDAIAVGDKLRCRLLQHARRRCREPRQRLRQPAPRRLADGLLRVGQGAEQRGRKRVRLQLAPVPRPQLACATPGCVERGAGEGSGGGGAGATHRIIPPPPRLLRPTVASHPRAWRCRHPRPGW
jgi:hypothetical protein